MSYLLIVGAKSDIAKAVAREYAKQGYDLYLAGREIHDLAEFANDLVVRYQITTQTIELDILNYQSHSDFYAHLTEKPLGVVCAVGYLGEQEKSQVDFTETQRILDSNYTGVVSLLNIIANNFEKRQAGFIIGISSVAGDRGRKSNYSYGAAKSALTTYLSGLRNRLYSSKVHVMTVKPGFVATKMTEGLNLPKKLTAQPEVVAKSIYQAQQANKNVLYTFRIWKWIMLIIKSIPEWKFKGMNI